MVSEKELNEILTRGVSSFIDPESAFVKKLKENPKDIIIKFGVDPTRPDIHLGHAVVFRKLRQLQNLGCKVVFLIGDYTTQIGDPTGKSKIRPELDQQQIEKNMQTYLDQVGKILKTDASVFSWIRNSDWFTSVTDLMPKEGIFVRIMNRGIDPKSFVGKAILFDQTRMQRKYLHKSQIVSISLSGFLRTLRKITHARLIERDMFKERLASGEELYMHEMMYPVLQGIDSQVIGLLYGSCDIEVGGSDQTFNMLIGRDVMKMNNQTPQAVLAFDILTGTDGKEKMSKSLDNYIAITDESENMYGKVMSIPDEVIMQYFTLATFTPVEEIGTLAVGLSNGDIHPKELKMRLAREIVAIYHGDAKAEKAEGSFQSTFAEGNIPENILTVSVQKNTPLIGILVQPDLISSKAEFRRLITQRGIHNLTDGSVVEDSAIEVHKESVFRIGKKKFIKVTIE